MNKLVPFTQFAKRIEKYPFLSNTSVVVDKGDVPLGFVFGRDAFISLLTVIDDTFEKQIDDPKKAFNNPAGKLIDLIEEKLPIAAGFEKELKKDISKARKSAWIPFKDIMAKLND